MPITTISNTQELALYQTELAATQDEQNKLLASLKESQKNPDPVAIQEYAPLRARINDINDPIAALRAQIARFEEQQAPKNQRPVENTLHAGVGMGWTILLGVGVILQETVAVTTRVLSTFLFPLHFVIDGLHSIWDLYRNIRDKHQAQRKTLIGANIGHISALIAAATVVALAVTNPFALPIIFLGINGIGLYKNKVILSATNQLIEDTKLELRDINTKIETLGSAVAVLLKPTDLAAHAVNRAMIDTLEATKMRLEHQLTQLDAKKSELRRGIAFNGLALVAVGLLLSSAVLSIVFPPAAAVVAMAGMLLFATTILTNVLTSPPVRGAFKRLGNWLTNTDDAENSYTVKASSKPSVEASAPTVESKAVVTDLLKRPNLRVIQPIAAEAAIPPADVKGGITRIRSLDSLYRFHQPANASQAAAEQSDGLLMAAVHK
jgi:uncharacterized protein (DUF2062 family)